MRDLRSAGLLACAVAVIASRSSSTSAMIAVCRRVDVSMFAPVRIIETNRPSMFAPVRIIETNRPACRGLQSNMCPAANAQLPLDTPVCSSLVRSLRSLRGPRLARYGRSVRLRLSKAQTSEIVERTDGVTEVGAGSATRRCESDRIASSDS